MDCERVREAGLAALTAEGGGTWPAEVAAHLGGCEACRAELEASRQLWALLGEWPGTTPPVEVRARVLRGVRRQFLKESVLTVSGWVPAVLAAAIGVGLSLGLSLLVPYPVLVALCRDALAVSDVHLGPYLMAGAAYGLPLAAGGWVLRRRVPGGGVIGSVEASLLFFVILAPYAIAQCREFPPALQAAFVGGLAGGAVLWSLAGLGVARMAPLRPARR